MFEDDVFILEVGFGETVVLEDKLFNHGVGYRDVSCVDHDVHDYNHDLLD